MKKPSAVKTVPDYLTAGRYSHVLGVLDREPPWIMRKLSPVLSSRVVIDDFVRDRLRSLADAGPLVYAMKFRSVYDLHYLRTQFAELGLPVPSFAFGVSPAQSGSVLKWARVWRNRVTSIFHDFSRQETVDENIVQEILARGGVAVLFLVDEQTSRERYIQPDVDPIRILLDLQGRLAGSVAIVPMTILYDRSQPRTIRPFRESFLGDPDRPGPLKRILIALRKWTVPELLIGEPVYLVGQFEEFGSDKSWEELPFEVRKDLIESINARIRVNRGPERLSRTEIKERVLQDPRLKRAVDRAVTRDPGSERTVRKQAESFVDEIAGDQRIQVHHFLYYLLKWLFATIFDGIDLRESQFAALKTKNQEGSLIYVSCHKSHLDYLLVGYLSFINQMAIPYMAAGKNLSFWPVGPLLRNAGAFFIRRTFKGLGLYPHVFAAYLKVLVKEKININFYIEGGRSRTGKLLPPRVGMLAFLLQTVKEGSVKDLTFVPTFVDYDQIPEERSYLTELAGKDKQAESMFAVIKSREILKKRFGKAYVRFHEPVSYLDFCNRFKAVAGPTNSSSIEENRKLLNGFAYYLMHAVARAGVVTPVELVSAGIACADRREVPHRFLMEAVGYLVDGLMKKGIEFAGNPADVQEAAHTALVLFKSRGFFELGGTDGDPVYLINDQKRANMDFYRNSLINFLWPEFLSAGLLLKGRTQGGEPPPGLREDFKFLKELLSKELIWNPLVDDDELVESSLGFLRKIGRSDDSAPERAEPFNGRLLECYRGAISDLPAIYYLVSATAEEVEDSGISQKEFTKRIAKTAAELFPEAGQRPAPTLGSVPISNALAVLTEMGALDYKPGRKQLTHVTDPQRLKEIKRFLGGILGLGT
ncbi:MAG: 1-acyl-sn-glycerol-3-phosphate acyltransferase [Pseudomonadota bacterium]